MGNIKIQSTDLFSMPSFSKGTSRLVDLYGKLDEYNYRKDADNHAIEKDWRNVGLDIHTSIDKYAAVQA